MRKAAAQVHQARAEVHRAGQRQSEGEQQIGQHRDEDRRLQLKAPADGITGGAQAEHRAGDRHTGQHHANRIGQRLPTAFGLLLGARLRQGQRLQREHRKHAGHQIQNQTAEQGQRQHSDQAGCQGRGPCVGGDVYCRRRRELGTGDRRHRARRGADFPGFGRVAAAQHQYALDRLRRIDIVGAELLRQPQCAGAIACRALRRRVIHQIVGVGEKRDRFGAAQRAAGQRKRDTAVRNLELCLPVGGCARQLYAGSREAWRPIGIDLRLHAHRQFQAQVRLARNADILADQPACLRSHRGDTACGLRDAERHQVQRFLVVAVVGQLAQ